MRALFLLFIVIPIVEMLLLFEVAEHIGGLTTVALVVLTAVIGINILKRQGFSTFRRASERLNAGQVPAQELVEGLFLGVGGAFLLTPGFITDTLGFLFIIGPSRRALVKRLIASGKLTIMTMGQRGAGFSHPGGSRPEPPGEHDVYEGEYTREQPTDSRLDDGDRGSR